MLKSLFFILHHRRTVGKLSEIKLVTSLAVGELKKAGNLKLFWFQLHSEL